jgi:hypothetical protein
VHALLRDDRGDEPGRRDVEGRIASREALGYFRWVALLDRDVRPRRRRAIKSRSRSDHVERNAVMRRQDGERIRSDLVRGVAVCGDPVCSGHDLRDLAPSHQRAGCGVGDDHVRDAGTLELPGRQAAALQEGPRLVDEDCGNQAAAEGGADRAEPAPVATGRQSAGVAVGQGRGA